MTVKLNSHTLFRMSYFRAGGLAVVLTALLTLHAQERVSNSRMPFHLEVQDAQGMRVAGPASVSTSSASAMIVFEREYMPGDRIVFSGPQRMAVRIDENLPECFLYS